MKVKTAELVGDALNGAVAMAQGMNFRNTYGHVVVDFIPKFSTDSEHGMQIIVEEGIGITPFRVGGNIILWSASRLESREYFTSTTPLIAAMRCYVAHKLGDEIELPEGLT